MTEGVLILLVGAVINGLVTYGVIKATLAHLAQGVREAKEEAARANERIDRLYETVAHEGHG